MPRSGSTLFEQVLAAHARVEGASELPDLEHVLQEESARRGRPFPEWVAQADAGDWQRLGRDYLQRTARWRDRRPRFTDKVTENSSEGRRGGKEGSGTCRSSGSTES